MSNISDYFKNLRYFKDPCKKCLVKITCNQKCDSFKNHKKYIDSWDYLSEDINVVLILTSFFVGIIFILITFGFGVWKWYEVIKSYFN